MVVSRNRQEDHEDRIFRALADHTRRDIVRRAMSGTLSVSGLARLYPMSTTAVQKHVTILEEAGLVVRTRRGREQLVQTTIDTIAEARRLLGEVEQLWRERLERIGDVLATPEGGDIVFCDPHSPCQRDTNENQHADQDDLAALYAALGV